MSQEKDSTNPNKGNTSSLTDADVHKELIQLINNAETTNWNRFYNFLMGNTILILAWATIFSSLGNSPCSAKCVLVFLSLIGGISGLFWAALGVRGRFLTYSYARMARKLEGKFTNLTIPPLELTQLITGADSLKEAEDNINKKLDKDNTRNDNDKTPFMEWSESCLGGKFLYRRSGSRYILVAGPLCFIILYIILFMASLCV